MIAALLAAGLAVALAAGVWLIFVAPYLRFQDALRRMARGDADAAFLIPPSFWLAGATAALCDVSRQISEIGRRQRDESIDLNAILSSVAEGVLVMDRSQRIRLANGSLARLFHLAEPAVGRTLMEVFRDASLRETAVAALEGEGPQSRQLLLNVLQNGRYAQRHFTVTIVRMEGGTGGVAIFHDITQLNALAAARRDFVANVSHELRTPLSIINGYLETLLDGALDDRPTARRFLETMSRHGERLNLLIEDLLSLSQLESRPGAGLNFAPTDLRTCLERVIERLEPLIAEKRTKVVLDLPAGAPDLEADAQRLDQVFFNLVENALKYASDGEAPCIRVTAAFEAEAVQVDVEDNGPGIPLLDLPHLFERFYRVHKDRSRSVGGTGLGLAIVKHVVQAHGGEVTAESEPGRGAKFGVRLPLSRAA